MKTFLLLAALAASSHADSQAKTADPKTVKFVESFVKAAIEDIPPERVEDFMKVDPETLPAKLRDRYNARKFELNALKQLAESKKKGTLRWPEKDCEIPSEAKSDQAGMLKMAGFEEIKEEEENHLLQKTQCTERDLMCEFSLQITLVRDPKTQKIKGRRYFLYTTDPLFALVAAYRSSKNVGGNTNFFGRANITCSH